MDHENAIRTQAAERYVLGELADDDAELFEAHYFDCIACAADVRDEMHLKELIPQIEVVAPVIPIATRAKRRLFHWMQPVAAALFALGIGIGRLFMPGVAPGVTTAHAFAISRDGGTQTFSRNEVIQGNYDIPGDDQYVSYAFEVRGESDGRRRSIDTVPAKEANETQLVTIGKLPAGSYILSIDGVRADGNRTSIQEVKFIVQ